MTLDPRPIGPPPIKQWMKQVLRTAFSRPLLLGVSVASALLVQYLLLRLGLGWPTAYLSMGLFALHGALGLTLAIDSRVRLDQPQLVATPAGRTRCLLLLMLDGLPMILIVTLFMFVGAEPQAGDSWFPLVLGTSLGGLAASTAVFGLNLLTLNCAVAPLHALPPQAGRSVSVLNRLARLRNPETARLATLIHVLIVPGAVCLGFFGPWVLAAVLGVLPILLGILSRVIFEEIFFGGERQQARAPAALPSRS